MAIIDLISILPSITILNNGFRLLKLFRLLRTLKVLQLPEKLSSNALLDVLNVLFTRDEILDKWKEIQEQ